MGLGRTHAHSQPPLFAVDSHLLSDLVPANHLNSKYRRPSWAEVTGFLMALSSEHVHPTLHPIPLKENRWGHLPPGEGWGQGSQVNQKGVVGWMALQGSLLMHSAAHPSSMRTSPAVFEKCKKKKKNKQVDTGVPSSWSTERGTTPPPFHPPLKMGLSSGRCPWTRPRFPWWAVRAPAICRTPKYNHSCAPQPGGDAPPPPHAPNRDWGDSR